MKEQSITPDVAIGTVRALPRQGFCMEISVTWSSSGASSYEVDRTLAGLASFPHVLVPRTAPVNSSFIDNVPDTQLYFYTVTLWDAQGHAVAGFSGNVRANPCPAIASQFMIQSKVDTFESRKGTFELLFAQEATIAHYTHKQGSIQAGHWRRVNTLRAPEGGAILDNAVSLIQSDTGNFEAVVVVTPPQHQGQHYLASYVFVPDRGWQAPSILKADGRIITGATGTPALIQSRQGIFELFVPMDNSIGHYRHEKGSIQDGSWTPLAPFGTDDTLTYTAISLVQPASSDQLELIIRATPVQTPQQGQTTDSLVAFVASSHDPQAPVQHVGPLVADGQPINGVTGSPTINQNDRGVFELIVPRGALMYQYISDKPSIGANLWKQVSTLDPLRNDPGIQFTATSLIPTSGKLALVARAMPPQGKGKDFPVSYVFTGWTEPRPFVVDDDSAIESDNDDR